MLLAHLVRNHISPVKFNKPNLVQISSSFEWTVGLASVEIKVVEDNETTMIHVMRDLERVSDQKKQIARRK